MFASTQYNSKKK